MFLLYSVLLTIGFVILLPRFIFDALTKGKYAAGFWQRMGRLPEFDPEGKPVVWLHCVSVGETQAARPLAEALLAAYPEWKLVFSTTTNTGQKLAQELLGGKAHIIYFPFDWKFAVRRSLRAIQPNVILLMETEIWPNFIREAGRSGAKVVIVNGRISEKSERRYRWVARTFRRIFHYVDLALMQTNADAQRLISLGVRGTKVTATGSLKFDQNILPEESGIAKQLRQRFDISKGSVLIIAASTHQPEERLLLEAFRILKENDGTIRWRMMIVPRHPERFGEIGKLMGESGYSFAKRSAPARSADHSADLILLDSIGELREIYSLGDIVFVGGSLIPHGGQNVLEPAAARRPIITGFYTMNFKDIVAEYAENDALRQLPELSEGDAPEALAEVFKELALDHERCDEMARKAFELIHRNQGGTERTMAKLRPYFEDVSQAAKAD